MLFGKKLSRVFGNFQEWPFLLRVKEVKPAPSLRATTAIDVAPQGYLVMCNMAPTTVFFTLLDEYLYLQNQSRLVIEKGKEKDELKFSWADQSVTLRTIYGVIPPLNLSWRECAERTLEQKKQFTIQDINVPKQQTFKTQTELVFPAKPSEMGIEVLLRLPFLDVKTTFKHTLALFPSDVVVNSDILSGLSTGLNFQ